MVAAGAATRAMSTAAMTMETQGRFRTRPAQPFQNRPSCADCSLITGTEFTRCPSTPIRAGMKVNDAATEKNTTKAPPIPRERSRGRGRTPSPLPPP